MSTSHKVKALAIIIPLLLFGVSIPLTSVVLRKPVRTSTEAAEPKAILSFVGPTTADPGTQGSVRVMLDSQGLASQGVEGRLTFSKDTIRIEAINPGKDFAILFDKQIGDGIAQFAAGANLGTTAPAVSEVVKLSVTFLKDGAGTIGFVFDRIESTDDTNVFGNDEDHDLLKKVDNYRVRIGTGPAEPEPSATPSGTPTTETPGSLPPTSTPTPSNQPVVQPPPLSPPAAPGGSGAVSPPQPAPGTSGSRAKKKGDITGSGGQPDGVVNSVDLGALIGKMGKKVAVGDPADLNSDTAVNVFDYSQFIPLIGK